jgi:hypothetical protein
MAQGMAQVKECLSSKHKGLSSNPNAVKQKEEDLAHIASNFAQKLHNL